MGAKSIYTVVEERSRDFICFGEHNEVFEPSNTSSLSSASCWFDFSFDDHSNPADHSHQILPIKRVYSLCRVIRHRFRFLQANTIHIGSKP